MEQSNKKVQLKECPICKNQDFSLVLNTADHFLTNEKFDLVKCNQCSLVFTNPIPTRDHLGSYYESSEYLSHKPEQKSLRNFVYRLVRKININRKYRLVSGYQASGSLLEIGIGTGELLNHFNQNGWETTGIEPNESARKYAISNYRLDVFEENKLNALPENSFDVIMLWHVMEHVYDLHERMQQIKRLLKKNGFVFIAVPNLRSPDFKKYKEYWAGLDVPRHLYHFTESSVSNLVNRYSLNIIAKYPMKFDAYYVSLLSEKYLGNRSPYFSALINGFKSNREAKTKNNYSSMIFVISE